MELIDTVQNLNEYWGPPAQNWFDFFVDASKLSELLSKRGNQEQVGRLAIQFAEQAASTQKETEMMMAKGFPNEDVQFAERKAACLVLCAMACFAYIEWDIEYLIDKYNEILSVRILIDNILVLCRSSETPSDAQFAEYLFAKWAMAVDRRYRLPPPPAKQTVNNPLLVPDMHLTKHENIRKMVVDTRTWFPQVIASLEKFIAEPKDLSVPGVNCFLTPFIEKGSISLGVGIVGVNVLCMWAPRPVFNLSTTMIFGADIVAASRFELLRFHFANGSIETAQELLKQITLPTSKSPLVSIDEKELNGYYLALNVPSIMPPMPLTVKEFLPNQKMLTDDSSAFRRLRIWRSHAVTKTSGQLQMSLKRCAFRSENAAKDVLEGRAASVRQRLLEKVVQQRFIKSLQRQISSVRDVVTRRRIDGLLVFLCATVAGMREELLRCGWDTPSRLRSLASQAPKTTTPPLSPQIVKMILTSENPFWTLLTSFNVTELKQAMTSIERPFMRPYMFIMPEMLADCVLITRPVNELHAVLLAKLNQLAAMLNRTEWDAECQTYWQEFGLPANCQIVMLTEAVRVHAQCITTRALRHDIPDAAGDERQMRSMKKLFKMNADADLLKKAGGVAFAAQTFARALNADDFDFITTEVKFPSTTTTMAQLLAAYLMSIAPGKDVSQMRKVCDTFNAHVGPLFDQIKSSRRDVARGRDREDQARAATVLELTRFLKLIRNESLLSFLITYFGYLFNRYLLAKKRPHLRMTLPLGEIFGHESEANHLNILAVQELLEIFFNNAILVNPSNPHWLRSAADFRYGRGLVGEAAILYVEYLVASRTPLLVASQENSVEDLIWRRLRVCLSKSYWFTLAALVCQNIEHKREEEYMKAMEFLFSQLSLDAGADYSCMVYDNTLAELMSDVYERNHMQPSADLLFSYAYRSCMNPEGRDVLVREQARRGQRLLRNLAAQLFDTHF